MAMRCCTLLAVVTPFLLNRGCVHAAVDGPPPSVVIRPWGKDAIRAQSQGWHKQTDRILATMNSTPPAHGRRRVAPITQPSSQLALKKKGERENKGSAVGVLS